MCGPCYKWKMPANYIHLTIPPPLPRLSSSFIATCWIAIQLGGRGVVEMGDRGIVGDGRERERESQYSRIFIEGLSNLLLSLSKATLFALLYCLDIFSIILLNIVYFILHRCLNSFTFKILSFGVVLNTSFCVGLFFCFSIVYRFIILI